jgi:arsenate reductase
MSVTLYEYPTCSTCRDARKWLDAHGVAFERVHLVEATPSREVLEDLWRRSGLALRAWFNTSGQRYKDGDWKTRLPLASASELLEALAADGMLIKRPVLDDGARVLVGFKPQDYDRWLATRAPAP